MIPYRDEPTLEDPEFRPLEYPFHSEVAGAPYSLDIDDHAKGRRHLERQEALEQESREGAW